MNRCVLIDGLEGSGKSHLFENLKKAHPEWSFVKCPSDSVIRKYFYEMISDDARLVGNFVDAMLDEVRQELQGKDNTTFVFDRGYLSTLVFQGKNHNCIRTINSKYRDLAEDLKFDFIDSCAIVMLEPKAGFARRDDKMTEKKQLGIDLDLKGRFEKFSTSENNPFPFYQFSYDRQVDFSVLNDIATEVLELR